MTESDATGDRQRDNLKGPVGVHANPERAREARIDCYIYPSLDEKQRATGNGTPANSTGLVS